MCFSTSLILRAVALHPVIHHRFCKRTKPYKTHTKSSQRHMYHRPTNTIQLNLVCFLHTCCFYFATLSRRWVGRIHTILLLLSGHWILCLDQGAELDEVVDDYGHRQDDEQNPNHCTDKAYQLALKCYRNHVSITHCGQCDHSPPKTRGNASEVRIFRVNFCIIKHGTEDERANEEYKRDHAESRHTGTKRVVEHSYIEHMLHQLEDAE